MVAWPDLPAASHELPRPYEDGATLADEMFAAVGRIAGAAGSPEDVGTREFLNAARRQPDRGCALSR